jgi:Na+/H+ antiporter NhaC
MNETDPQSDPPPNYDGSDSAKVMWLFAAFLPSVIGIACFNLKHPGQWMLPILVLINAIISVVAGTRLVKGMKDELVQGLLAAFLVIFFFVLNAFIVIFVGCTSMGRIAP